MHAPIRRPSGRNFGLKFNILVSQLLVSGSNRVGRPTRPFTLVPHLTKVSSPCLLPSPSSSVRVQLSTGLTVRGHCSGTMTSLRDRTYRRTLQSDLAPVLL